MPKCNDLAPGSGCVFREEDDECIKPHEFKCCFGGQIFTLNGDAKTPSDDNHKTSDDWEALKLQGSEHYRTRGVQPIDLYRDTVPHISLTALDVKALTDCIKYAHRQLTRGYSEKDTEKMQHYLALIKAAK